MIIDFTNKTEQKQNFGLSERFCMINDKEVSYQEWDSEIRQDVIECLDRYLERLNDKTTDIGEILSDLKTEVNNLIHTEEKCLIL